MPQAAAASPWEWHPHPDVWVLIAGLLGGYFLALRVLRPTAPLDEQRVSRGKVGCYLAGVATLWVAADWPLHELSEDFLFSAHMVQHMLLSLVAPPLLLLGIPAWVWRAGLRSARVLRVARFLTRPLFALLLFNAVIAVTHWPTLVDLSLRSEPAHLVLHSILVGSALLMWWPVISPLPELSRLSEPGKMLYLFLQSIVPTVPASFLTFADAPLYRFYETVPRLWGISVLTDQQAAGLIMKIVGGLLLWVGIAILFFRWHAREQAGDVEVIGWEDFERELEAWDLRK